MNSSRDIISPPFLSYKRPFVTYTLVSGRHFRLAGELRRVFVEANERDFVQWDRVRALIAAAAEQRGEGNA